MADGERKKSKSNWFLWWQIDEDELHKQAAEYSTLKFWQSARGGAVVCLAISILISAVAAYFHVLGLDASAFVDVGLMVILALLIAMGHRWAMLVAMVYWTASKIFAIVGSVQLGTGYLVVTHIIWWGIYMHAFYFALRVEQLRRKPALKPEVSS